MFVRHNSCACVRVFVRACVFADERSNVCTCVRACVSVRACVRIRVSACIFNRVPVCVCA